MTSPLGPISLAQQALRDMLSESSTVQTWMSAGDAATALAKIYNDTLPAPDSGKQYTKVELEALRPYAIVWTDNEGGAYELRHHASGFDFTEQGRLKAVLCQNVPEAVASDANIAEAELRWRNTIGQIIMDVANQAGKGGKLCITGIKIDAGPYRTHPDYINDEGDAQLVELCFTWGPN